MAGTQWHPPLDLIAQLKRCPGQFSFFQALRLLSLRQASPGGQSRPGFPPDLRFRNRMGSAFPPGDVGAWEPGDSAEAPTLELLCLGLTGPGSPLPAAWLEALMEDPDAEGIQALLDVFTHRLALLVLEAWRSSRPWAQAEIRSPGGVMAHLQDLCGPGRDLQDPALAGLLLRRPLPAEAFRSLAQAVLGVPVSLEPFRAAWHPLPLQHRARLGGPTAVLRGTTPLGPRWMDRQGSLGMQLGPMERLAFRELLPGGLQHEKLINMASLVSHPHPSPLKIQAQVQGVTGFRLGVQACGHGLGQCARIASHMAPESPCNYTLNWKPAPV